MGVKESQSPLVEMLRGWRRGGLVSIRPGDGLHMKADVYLRGGEGGCQRNACDLRVGIKTSRRLGGKVAGGLCRSWEHRSWGGGYGGPLSLPYCYCSPPDPRWLQTTMEATHTGAT